MTPADLLSYAGRLLYRELPEEHRYRDGPEIPGEARDLEAFLHGFGHLLDLVRATTEQAYADSFAEPQDDGRAIQTWLIPYLAELVGAELVAPDPSRRTEELNNAVGWYKSKGTLLGVDQVGDVVGGGETVTREGWRLTLATPRIGLPPFTIRPAAPGATAPDGAPLAAPEEAGSLPPLGTPDFRRHDRAVRDPSGSSPLFRVRQPARDALGRPAAATTTFWRPLARGGVPCFPGGYDDDAPRCPDLRDPARHAEVGPHPRRALVHLRPPDGLFAAGLRRVPMPPADKLAFAIDPIGWQDIGPAEILAALDRPPAEAEGLDRLEVEPAAHVDIPAGARLRFRNLLFVGQVRRSGGSPDSDPVRLRLAPGARLRLERSAAPEVVIDRPDALDLPAFEAEDSLIGRITGPEAFAQLVYATVLGETDLARLNASDSLLATLSSNLNCAQGATCLRFSRVTPAPGVADCLAGAPSNTTRPPVFARRWFRDGDACVLRPPRYGEPGCGVLDTSCPPEISAGAEDEGEMGAGHHLWLAAQLRALSAKLADFVPFGQEIALRYDPLLQRPPPALAGDGA